MMFKYYRFIIRQKLNSVAAQITAARLHADKIGNSIIISPVDNTSSLLAG